MDINDIKEKIEAVVDKLTGDKDLMDQFKKDPVKALEKVLGVDLPDEAIEKVVDGVKAKLTADKIGDVADTLKGLFNKD